MAKFRKDGGRALPGLSTSSLPDIVFMLLFFFMTATSMKEVTYKVNINLPNATQLTKLEKKSLVKYVYIGQPKKEWVKYVGTESCIQLDDEFVKDADKVQTYIIDKRAAMNEDDQGQMVVSMKVDKDTKMGIVTDVKQSLRNANALKINYTALGK